MDLMADGAFQLGSFAVRLADITDGLSFTIFAGEKHVQLGQFGVGWNDCSQYNGDYVVCATRGAGTDYPLAATPRDTGWRFGSYHPNICQFVFGDGSVRIIQVSINPATLGLLAGINDGVPITEF